MKSQRKKILTSIVIIIASVVVLSASFAIVFFTRFPQFIPLARIAPDVLGFQGKRTYLILFQNNEELRPGGGFIGAYGIVSFYKGHIGPITIHNVYDADGLLHKHIEPYFISRRYLQAHLYMRDSNFDIDFVKSAQKAEYMLNQETGQKVDGAVAIDVSFISSLIQKLQPIYLWQYNTTINGSNFFLLTEKYADKNSFAGSTQKQDFLRILFNAMQEKFDTDKLFYTFMFLAKIADATQQKHLLIAINDPSIQKMLTEGKLSSALYDPRVDKPGTITDFLGVNEANIGSNKANYFLKRKIMQNVDISPEGIVREQLAITYTNTTHSEVWPSGTYKNYLRLILPLHAKLQNISINNQKQHIVPAVTDFRIYEAPDFHAPDGLEVDTSQEAGKSIYGFIVSVRPKETKTVMVTYKLSNEINMSNLANYNLYVFKQPGTNNDPYAFTLHLPKSYVSKNKENQTFLLSIDRDITIPIFKQ